MDAYILTKLDQLRDTQRDHGEILNRLLIAAEKPRSPDGDSGFLAKLRLPLSLRKIGVGVIYILISGLIASHLKHGGDAISVLELLLKYLL